ncbi:HEAT repeat domain-containing protein [Alkalibacterium sp. f15]|uniref:HEAT repeat domain-containing protein n=1 Tax=Alkalibacterium sp. f15 TaxID=3414029 RepID=UPI003BF8823B
MLRQYIWALLIILLAVNVVIFIFLLIKKIAMKVVRNKKAGIRKTFEEDFLRFITKQDSEISIEPKSYLEKKVLQSLILEYNSFISGTNQTVLLNNIGKNSVIDKVERYLNSNNLWKKKTGTFLAGEYESSEMMPLLLKQLQTTDNELFFVTARSLIQISNAIYLREILEKAIKQTQMSKNNILSLLELVEGDIKEILEDLMESDDTFLQVVALEEIGKRQYQGSVKWIEKMIGHPQKELRIAALKASFMLGNIGDDKYLSYIMSLENDPEWEVRSFLAKYLRKVNRDDSIKILTIFMSDENWYVRHNAAESLLTHENEGHVALLGLLDSDDSFARDAANAVLQKEALYE